MTTQQLDTIEAISDEHKTPQEAAMLSKHYMLKDIGAPSLYEGNDSVDYFDERIRDQQSYDAYKAMRTYLQTRAQYGSVRTLVASYKQRLQSKLTAAELREFNPILECRYLDMLCHALGVCDALQSQYVDVLTVRVHVANFAVEHGAGHSNLFAGMFGDHKQDLLTKLLASHKHGCERLAAKPDPIHHKLAQALDPNSAYFKQNKSADILDALQTAIKRHLCKYYNVLFDAQNGVQVDEHMRELYLPQIQSVSKDMPRAQLLLRKAVLPLWIALREQPANRHEDLKPHEDLKSHEDPKSHEDLKSHSDGYIIKELYAHIHQPRHQAIYDMLAHACNSDNYHLTPDLYLSYLELVASIANHKVAMYVANYNYYNSITHVLDSIAKSIELASNDLQL